MTKAAAVQPQLQPAATPQPQDPGPARWGVCIRYLRTDSPAGSTAIH